MSKLWIQIYKKMRAAIPLLLIFSLVACGPAHKLRKAQRLMDQAIAMGAKVKADTVYLDKIIPGESTRVEVPIEKLIRKDTTIYQDKIKIQWKVRRDTLRLSVECPPDTIRIPVTVHKSIVCPDCPRDRFWKGFGWGSAALLALLILYGVVRLIRP